CLGKWNGSKSSMLTLSRSVEPRARSRAGAPSLKSVHAREMRACFSWIFLTAADGPFRAGDVVGQLFGRLRQVEGGFSCENAESLMFALRPPGGEIRTR